MSLRSLNGRDINLAKRGSWKLLHEDDLVWEIGRRKGFLDRFFDGFLGFFFGPWVVASSYDGKKSKDVAFAVIRDAIAI
jgi:hypothetical protein